MTTRAMLGFAVFTGLWYAMPLPASPDLAAGFADPPESARPWAYWWWLDSYATKEGITRDLEEMKRQGIGGVLIFDAGEGKGSPVGPVFMSPAWRELFTHAIREADRLGIEVGVNLCSGWNAGGTWVMPEHAAKTLVWSETQVQGPGEIRIVVPRPEARENYYRDVAVLAFPAGARPAGAAPLKHWEVKAARTWLKDMPEKLHEEDAGIPGERDCESRQVIDLSKRLDAAGRLTWDAPPGAWTVLRLGCTLLGARTKCVSPGAQGFEIDFLSAAAMDVHWAETAAKLIADAGPLVGKTLRYVHDDSYEVCGPNGLQLNWTPQFLAEFRARRGYDPLPYLPVLAGKIVDSRKISNRFLWDYRRTIADLFADGHYRRMRDLAQKHGLGTHPESGGPFWPSIDALQLEGINDIPMGEFWKRQSEPDGKIVWADNYHICDTVKQAASAAHIYGRRICQAEAWTSMGPNWEEDLFDLKDVGDRAFCAGLTRNVLCFYVHQGRLDTFPGYQWEAAGTHFDRNVTWWPMSHAWLTYLSRCQFMLQQGLFVADVLYFYGEDAPNYVPARTHMRPALPKGYDCDTINAEALLTRLSVRDGRLVLPDGMSYRLLVLPERRLMSPHILRKIGELVEAGATVVGPRPVRAPGLAGYPQCDEEVKRIAADLWGRPPAPQTQPNPERQRAGQNPNPERERAGQNRAGRGRIIWGQPLADVLAADGVRPDFEYRASAPDANLDFIHRTCEGGEIYFVSNQLNRPEKAECAFRVSGRRPEVWDPATGESWLPSFAGGADSTELTLPFSPRQSWFVVFRDPIRPGDDRARPLPVLTNVAELSGPWIVRFDPKWGGPVSVVFEQLVDWTTRSEPGIRYYSGRAVYEKAFDLPRSLPAAGRSLYLDLGKVRNVAEVRLNGKDLGVVWTAPWHVDITAAVRPTGNKLEIAVVNLWPNRLIGDADLPAEKRLTITNVRKFKKDSPLLPSGLLGPVTLRAEEVYR